MYFKMFCKTTLIGIQLAAFVALEWSLTSVRPLVTLQITRLSGCIVALVTLERLLFCMLSHYVEFQLTSCDARILARCASLWLFTRVRLLVRRQLACFCCFIFTLIAIVQFLPSVLLDMHFESGSPVA